MVPLSIISLRNILQGSPDVPVVVDICGILLYSIDRLSYKVGSFATFGEQTLSYMTPCMAVAWYTMHGMHVTKMAETVWRVAIIVHGVQYIYKTTGGINKSPSPLNLLVNMGVTKRCRLTWLINSSLVYEPKCGWM